MAGESTMEAILAGLARSRLRCGLIVCGMRTENPEDSIRAARLAIANAEDGVVGFKIDQETGELMFVDVAKLAPSIHPGLAARSLKFDPSGKFLFVGDRPANQVVTFVVDGETGHMTKVASSDVSQPAFVLVVAG